MMTKRAAVATAASLIFSTLLVKTNANATTAAQAPAGPYVRWAELEISPAKLAEFREASRDIAAPTLQEPGVVAFHSAAEKGNPTQVRVLEVYADAAAYGTHLQSPHFQRFAQASQPVLVARRVYDTVPILLGAKPGITSPAPHVRVAELEIHANQLDAYKAAVRQEIEDSIAVEPGVLAIYSVALKDQPTHLRFFEIYADEAAYRAHIVSPHFKKYVETTQSMIAARKLFEMDSPVLGIKNAH
ncbi:quinol monooxygenase YgiN [Acidovorax sp. 69]|uniref:putative quinol monooxygenase n=1 Tax=Acidovorax sp. 69 TaxID=2035202 RepID=UPI000CA6DB46|nr:antibiotic biosynthesis monooxygenase [Acidovorax sp. 69]PJI97641.1 quinol monooxygenase YgiN [Acidovorax sp. 69]